MAKATTKPAPITAGKPLERTTLTDVQKRKWIETRSALLWRAPAFTHILFSMLNPTRGELAALFTTQVPIAATDGSNLILNPETFFEFSLDERVFIVAHEIMHCILNHCVLSHPMRRDKIVKYADGSKLDYDAKLMNVAMDLVINDTLINDKIGKFPTIGLHDPATATLKDGFLDAYKKVWKDPEKFPGGGFDVIMSPGAGQGKDPGQAAADRSQTEWDTAVAAAITSAKMQGKLSANLERLLGEIVEPTVQWQDHIRALFARKIGAGGYDWRKPDRRLIQRDIYAPQRSGNGCGTIVVGVDTSGSIGQKILDVFFGEMRGILDDVRPTEIHVVWCDAKVHKVDTVDDSQDISSLKAAGGGGTRFEPVFEWIEKEGITPEALVYLTDGLGSFPSEQPAYPVIWGALKGYNVKYPFGDVVEIEIK
jgi:predicted metal-dependent peptidase